MTSSRANSSQTVEVPVSLNGILRVSIPSHMNAEEFLQRALEHFAEKLRTKSQLGETGEAAYSFDGEVWSTEDQAQLGDVLFEVQHDIAAQVSGAVVALKPRAGTFGENRFRSRVGAYVSEHDIYVTARCPQTDAERVLVNIRMTDGDPTVYVMDPATNEYDSVDGELPIFSATFPRMSYGVN